MSRTVTVEPVTRIEGHAKITIELDDAGAVRDALFHVTQFRGFEKFVQGRPMVEMPSITSRICGICPVSHLMASAKACDDLLAVEIPPTAAKLRRMMNLAQFVQSHALSFFHLSSPDLLLGMDSDPAQRNLFGLIEKHPERARDGVKLRKFGQQVIETLGGKRIHPAWLVPGGVNQALSAESRDRIREGIPEAKTIAQRTLAFFESIVDRYSEEIAHFAHFPTRFAALTTPGGEWENYDGPWRVMDADGNVEDVLTDHRAYGDLIGEAAEPHSYLKSPYYKPAGFPDGIYRVGPLARINITHSLSSPEGYAALTAFRERAGRPAHSSFHYHWARLIEVLHAVAEIEALANDPEILDPHVRARAEPNRNEGVGISEAPRGTLIHHYRIDDDGLMTWGNLIIATGHNNLAMNRGVKQVAEHFVDGNNLQEGMLNRVEAVIRSFDPCLSCSTHAIGQMPLRIDLVDASGNRLDALERN